MVSFDLSSISMMTKEIVEDEVALFTERIISVLSINIFYYQGNIVQVVDSSFCFCISVLLGASFCAPGQFLSF